MKVLQFAPFIDKEEVVEVLDCFVDNWLTEGKKTAEFQSRIAEMIGVKHAIACNNGTIALFMACKMIGIEQGDEVIVPDFTFIASSNAVILAGGTPVFCDVEFGTWNIDVKSAEKCINSKTKAIMPVHIYGQAANMTAVMKLAKKYNLKVIEDAAQGIGVTWGKQPVGSFGDVGTLSFYADKTLTCLPAETKILNILNKKGSGGSRTVNISDIKVGDKVVSYNEVTSEKELDDVVECFRNQTDHLYTILFSNNNKLKITGNHPVYVINKGWVKAEDLLVGDKVIQYKYYGLAQRINGLNCGGKTLKELHGDKWFEEWRINHSSKISKLHQDKDSGYAKMDNETRYKHISEGNKRFAKTEKGLADFQKRSKIMKSLHANPDSMYNTPMYRLLKSIKSKEVGQRPEVIEARRSSSINNWLNPQYREMVTRLSNDARKTDAYIKAYIKGCNTKPNRSEKRLTGIINSVCPDYKYNGDYSLGVSIDGYIPDFVNVNGKKKAIELFGEYWHKENEVEERKERMAKLGWDCLIIWEKELKNIEAVKNKVETFNYNPKIEIVSITDIKKELTEQTVYNIRTKKNSNYFAYGILVHNCGEGGMVLTNNDEYAYIANYLKCQGNPTKGFYTHQHIGFNFRFTDLQAAVGIGQLNKLDKIIARKHEMDAIYRKELKDYPVKFAEYSKANNNVPFRIGILLDSPDKMMEHLNKKEVQTRRYFYPLHLQPCYQGKYYRGDVCSNTEYAYAHGLCLPSGVGLKDEEVKYVCDSIKEFYDN